MTDKDLSKQIELSTPEEAKNIVVESLPIQCRSIGLSFFNCVEGQILKLSSDISLNYTDIEAKMTNEFVPNCMEKFNLEACLTKNDSNIK